MPDREFVGSTAPLHGVYGALTWTGGPSTSENVITSIEETDNFEFTEFRNAANKITGGTITNPTKVIRVTFQLEAADETTVKTKFLIPDPMRHVTLSATPGTEFDGTWNYLGGASRAMTQGANATVSIVLGRFDGAALAQPA